MTTGDILVSAAGPVSNILLGLVAAVVYAVLWKYAREHVVTGTAGAYLLGRFMLVNAGLAIFNLLPIPPLDGSHVADSLMPSRWRSSWERFAQAGPLVLIGLIALEAWGNMPILSSVLGPPRRLLISLYTTVIGFAA
jgi:Zn-dependent protease